MSHDDTRPGRRYLEHVSHLIERVASEVLPRSHSHSHPRSFPFIDGSGLEAGIAAAVLAAALDSNLGGGAGLASEIEDVAWRWLAELIGFPAGGGHFTSGGTLANPPAPHATSAKRSRLAGRLR